MTTDRLSAVGLLLGALALGACGSSDEGRRAPDGDQAKVSLATAAAGELQVELLTDTRLETGLTAVYVKLTTSAGELVRDATVALQPMMTMMGGISHSAPVLAEPARAAEGLYPWAVVFQMASGAMGSWSAKVTVTRPGATAAEASFEALTVADSGRAKVFSFTAPGAVMATKVVASLNFTAPPRVGLNPVIVTLHTMQDALTFAPIEDAELALDPQMPSMGHGSPGSVDPTHSSLGRYEGKLSFSMADPWETTLTISRGGATLGAPKFETTF
ncbi:MAG: FixH family protein [Proteobacteria bacterium]|nr:FixH family protein [Pseudomonadota bacterium]